MEVVGCVSAVVALLSKGNQLIELIVTLRDARSEIAERVTKIQSHWVQTKVQLDFAERAWTGLSEEHQETQLNVLELLHGKDDIKWHLVGLAKDKLRSVLGDMYKEVVVSCLTCLDGDSDDYGELVDEEDADGVGVGVRFIQKVLLKLNEISV
ncbi:unnamed protein product [Zymoseptoria tritici ST99CH_3D7]|uniref:Uncharacterized protein n=1 Tax=Zymoseptoria tritici (strain ST99CH_3D7) TaxID=1276538 RepID=A0A1X7RCC3_ZYMT9|nr:unnamed protein product [Zymoseptoria tritici ST99CH_3D7]